MDLDSVEIFLSSEGRPSVTDNENKSTSGDWTILHLKPVNNYTAGLAVEGNEKYTFNFYIFLMSNKYA